MRIRMWGVTGFINSRLYNNTTSSVLNDDSGASSVRMNFEQSNNASTINAQISHRWILTTVADNQDIHHQLFSTDNSTNSSVQSDSNGYNLHMWKRIG